MIQEARASASSSIVDVPHPSPPPPPAFAPSSVAEPPPQAPSPVDPPSASTGTAAPAAPIALTIVPPGTFRWVIQDDGQCELLVIDAWLMPDGFVRYARIAVSTFVFPTKIAASVDELISSPQDELAWTCGNYPPGFLGDDAVVARVPAGTFVDVWVAAQEGNKTTRPRSVAMALCIASALIQPLERADTDVKTVLGHDEFQRLVDEARAELDRARVAWRKKVAIRYRS